jgi:hypothetical protein
VKRPVPTESQEAIAFCDWCRLHESRYPALRWLFAVPNGAARHKVTAGRLKAEGVKAGVPDYLLPYAATRTSPHEFEPWFGLAIELKRTNASPSRTSPEQREWLTHLESQGWCCVVARGAGEAMAAVSEYLGIPQAPRYPDGPVKRIEGYVRYEA